MFYPKCKVKKKPFSVRNANSCSSRKFVRTLHKLKRPRKEVSMQALEY